MQAGTLNETIKVYRQTYSKSEFGEQKTEEWKEHLNIRACVNYQNGLRTNDNNSIFFAQNIIFYTRIYQDIINLDRIEWKDNKYRILNIWPNRQIQRLEITTELIDE